MALVRLANPVIGVLSVINSVVLVVHQTHVVLLMALVYRALMDTGENDVIDYAAEVVPISVHNLTELVRV